MYSLIHINDKPLSVQCLLMGASPADPLEVRFCALQARLKRIYDFLDKFQPTTEDAEAVLFAVKNMLTVTSANILQSKLMKNERDLERTLQEKERVAMKIERAIRPWREVIPA